MINSISFGHLCVAQLSAEDPNSKEKLKQEEENGRKRMNVLNKHRELTDHEVKLN